MFIGEKILDEKQITFSLEWLDGHLNDLFSLLFSFLQHWKNFPLHQQIHKTHT